MKNLVGRINGIWHRNRLTLDRFNNFYQFPRFGFIRNIV